MPGLENATRICDAKFAALYMCEADSFRAVAARRDVPPGYVEARRREPQLRPPPDTPLGRVAASRRCLNGRRGSARPSSAIYSCATAMRTAPRTASVTPMTRRIVPPGILECNTFY